MTLLGSGLQCLLVVLAVDFKQKHRSPGRGQNLKGRPTITSNGHSSDFAVLFAGPVLFTITINTCVRNQKLRRNRLTAAAGSTGATRMDRSPSEFASDVRLGWRDLQSHHATLQQTLGTETVQDKSEPATHSGQCIAYTSNYMCTMASIAFYRCIDDYRWLYVYIYI